MATVALTDGSQLWAAQLDDDRYLPEYRERLKAARGSRGAGGAPSLVGYTRLVAAVDQLTDHVYMLRAEQGQWIHTPARAKPKFPADKVDDEHIAMGRSKIGAVLDEAHRWREAS